MRNRLALLAPGLALLLASWTHAAGHPATVYTVDNQKLVANVVEDAFVIRTSCGSVAVPAEDVTALYPGFSASEALRKRIEGLIPRLTTANKVQAAHDLLAIGRPAVPQLQAAAAVEDGELAKEAGAVLKTLWPSGAKVPSDGSEILFTKTMEFRGVFTFPSVRLEGSFGKKTLATSEIRLIQFDPGEVPPAGDPPANGVVKVGKAPELELSMSDGTRIIGTLEPGALDVDTRYGRLTVPVKELISVKLGDPDEVVTRDMTFQGKLATAAFRVRSKVGVFNLERDKVQSMKVLLSEPVTPPVPNPLDVIKPGQWIDIFNGKDLKGWKPHGGDANAKIENKILQLTGSGGLEFQGAGDVKNVLVAVRAKLNAFTAAESNFIMAVRQCDAGSYYVRFDGKNASIRSWGAKGPGAILKSVKCELQMGEWYLFQFGIMDTLLMASVNGKTVAECAVDSKEALPAGKVLVMITNGDASLRAIQIKILK